MESLKDRALKYAENKVKDLLTSAISQAYMDGYNDGWKEKEEGVNVASYAKKVHFVDLGLPSGTLWAMNYLINDKGDFLYLPYEKAVRLGIPSLEQWEELKSCCVWEAQALYDKSNKQIGSYYTCTGRNGNYIVFLPTPELHGDTFTPAGYNNSTTSWLQLAKENDVNSFNVHRDPSTVKKELKTFEGWQLPVRLVLKH